CLEDGLVRPNKRRTSPASKRKLFGISPAFRRKVILILNSIKFLFVRIERVVIFSILIFSVCSFSSPASSHTSNTPFPQATELQQGPPLTNQEFVQLLYQLPQHPEAKDKLV